MGPPVPAGTGGVMAAVPASVATGVDVDRAGAVLGNWAPRATVAPAVDATTSTAVPPTASGVAAHPRQPRSSPRRMGISRKWKEITDTPNATATRKRNRGHPSSPVRAWSNRTKIGQCHRYRP